MNTRLHLVAMPWSNPHSPSPQLAALQAYIDAALADQVRTTAYSAFIDILVHGRGESYVDLHSTFADHGDYLYFLMCRRRFPPRGQRARLPSLAGLLKPLARSAGVKPPHLRRMIDLLERRTCSYIEEIFVPELDPGALNVVGLTLSFAQLYSSIYFARYLQERHPGFKYLFVFGGEMAGVPKVVGVLRRFGIRGTGVLGEGERTLEQILRRCLALPANAADALPAEIKSRVPGSYAVESGAAALLELRPWTPGEQIERIEDLPLPAFDEYFAALRRALPRRRALREFTEAIDLVVEGSRGCVFGQCDFCDVSRTWRGHRAAEPEWVAERVLELVRKYRCPSVWFLDCTCDSWAGGYAGFLIKHGSRVRAAMELRVHHPLSFWTQLSLAGVEKIQVGIEAVAPKLLRAMNKGTTVWQNLRVQKWLKELGIESCSNIITHHPKSTLQDIALTERVLSQMVHLDRLEVSPCVLEVGSPLAKGLSSEQLRRLTERHEFSWPGALAPYLVSGAQYEFPKRMRSERVMRAWDTFVQWEEEWFGRYHELATLTQTRCGKGELLVRDGRFDDSVEYLLRGPRAAVYEACHEGMTTSQLSIATGFDEPELRQELKWLLGAKLILDINGWFLSLALRPRDELLRTYFETS